MRAYLHIVNINYLCMVIVGMHGWDTEGVNSYLILPLSMALIPSAVLPPGLVTSPLQYANHVPVSPYTCNAGSRGNKT